MEIVPISPDREMLKLLQGCDLPVSDIDSSDSLYFYGCHGDGKVTGVVGLEVHGKVALIRSLAVCSNLRRFGVGGLLVQFAENMARKKGVESLFLLTTTASEFFERLGYEYYQRENAPESIKATAQFSGLCPATSSFMGKSL
ncbi:arsenic resistance N-acetyltransferase ArsN2 [Haliea sp.]